MTVVRSVKCMVAELIQDYASIFSIYLTNVKLKYRHDSDIHEGLMKLVTLKDVMAL